MNYEELQARLVSADEAHAIGNYSIIEPLARSVLSELEQSNAPEIVPSPEKDTRRELLLRAHALLALGTNARVKSNYPQALEYFRASQTASETANDPNGCAMAINGAGNAYQHLSEYALALEEYRKANVIFERIGNREWMAICWGSIGRVYQNLSDYSLSLDYMHKALVMNEEIGSRIGIAMNLGNIAVIYWRLSEYDHTLEYLKKSLALNQEIDNKEGIAMNHGNIGVLYSDLRDYQQSLEYLQKSVALFETLDRKDGLAFNFGNIGSVYVHLGEYAPALEYHQKALEINQSIGNKESTAVNLGNLGVMYSTVDFAGYNAATAEEYLLKALALDEEIGSKQQAYGHHKSLAELYKNEKRWEDAMIHFEKFYELEKAVLSEEAHHKSAQLEQQKQLTEREKQHEFERIRAHATDEILANILPQNITERLLNGEKKIADTYDQVSVLFVDIVGFTKLSAKIPAGELIDILDIVFTRFDTICKKHGLEKIKTIGDAYMAVCGAPVTYADHAERAASAAVEMLGAMAIEQSFSIPVSVECRIGLHTGSVVAGIIGENKYSYDLWGDAVNSASRMESHGEAGKIHVSEDFKRAFLETDDTGESSKSILFFSSIHFIERGEMDIKGKGIMRTYFLESI